MSTVLAPLPLTGALQLDVQALAVTEDQFLQLCADNRELRLELTTNRELIVMPPAGGETGWRENKLSVRLGLWAEEDGSGVAFSPTAGFRLPNGAIRSPDASWLSREQWDALSPAERAGFPPLCPAFVAEIRSPSDRLAPLWDKMEEYLASGARLGWLIDPEARRVYVYRPGEAVEVLDDPPSLSGDPVLPGFVFDVRSIW